MYCHHSTQLQALLQLQLHSVLGSDVPKCDLHIRAAGAGCGPLGPRRLDLLQGELHHQLVGLSAEEVEAILVDSEDAGGWHSRGATALDQEEGGAEHGRGAEEAQKLGTGLVGAERLHLLPVLAKQAEPRRAGLDAVQLGRNVPLGLPPGMQGKAG